MSKKVVVECEGDTDRAVLDALIACGVLPGTLDVHPKQRKTGGVSTLGDRVAVRLNAKERVVALRDIDDYAEPKDAASIVWSAAQQSQMNAGSVVALAALSPDRNGRIFRGTASVDGETVVCSIVLAGLPGDAALTPLGVNSHAIDDYLVRLLLDPDAYAAFAASESYIVVDHSKVLEKMGELQRLFAANEMPLQASKRHLHLLRGTINFNGSPATFAELLVRRVGKVVGNRVLQAHFEPLVGDLTAAIS